MAAPCELLTWDTDFFGRRIAHVNSHTLDADTMQAVLDWCARQQIDCLYFLAASDDALTVRLAEECGFRLQDVRTTLDRSLPAPPAGPLPAGMLLRPAAAGDGDALRAIARTAYVLSRFYNDPCFSEAESSRMYEVWIARSIGDYAELALVAELEGCPVGYITGHLRPGNVGEIGLVGVAKEARGRQVGPAMVAAALEWFTAQGMARVTVVTQGRNIGAQRLYQKAGFMTQSVQLWYHKWFTGCPGDAANGV